MPLFLEHLLELTPDLFDVGDTVPDALSLYVPEGRQLLRPTMALKRHSDDEGKVAGSILPADRTPASEAGIGYLALVWDLPRGPDGSPLGLDKPEIVTGPWDYPPAAKFERLLRNCRVPIGLLTNGSEVRLVYAPHGESSGAITFAIDDVATVGGRPILDAFIMLLSATRWYGVAPEHQLPALLRESRQRQASVTTELAAQVFDALQTLLTGFEAAAERDGANTLAEALERDDDHVYGGLLTIMLRLVFLLYAEDRGLLPVDHPVYAEHMSVLGLFQDLQRDQGNYPDAMSQRFGAYDRLISLFRAVYLGAHHAELRMPARRGHLFDPNEYPFVEGWGAGSAPIFQPDDRAAVRVPSVDDGTIYSVLRKLLYFQGQRLSYRALDVEQIGSVYEALMGYHVRRLEAPAVCLRPNRVWVTTSELEAIPPAQRGKWLKQEVGLSGADAGKLAKAFRTACSQADGPQKAQLEALELCRERRRLEALGGSRARAGRLVIQPGAERKRTSSHYTPRSLSAPIVERTLEPLLKAMGTEPASKDLLDLKICDPAMGSGAFLVETCRFLGDQVVAAWTREGKLERIADVHDDVVNHARRLVAQRCLYGVDKNPFAVNLAKLSLWLLTQAKELPFTFLDHCLRHGDSLVGLSFAQIEAFHWKPGAQESAQLSFLAKEVQTGMNEALALRTRILELARDGTEESQREKELLLGDAEDALARVKLVADVCLGAFFAEGKDKARELERKRRLAIVEIWLASEEPATAELLELQQQMRATTPPFHWMAEFPEVFHGGRADPLEGGEVNQAAFIDAFVGNPPFLGGKRISTEQGTSYTAWLDAIHGAGKNGDLSAHFFRRADVLLGSHGTMGLIATNTISQGDTRSTGLQRLVKKKCVLYDATCDLQWPGTSAAVTVSVIHLAKGTAANDVSPRLNGSNVVVLNSRLRPKPERDDPGRLRANAGMSYQGSILVGLGFTLTHEERSALIARAPRNAERIFPYLGGEEVNTSPTQSPHRHVISFGDMPLEAAGRWPDLLDIVRNKVKPERDKVKRDAHRKYWWHYGDKRPALYRAIAPLPRCLVTSRVTKHLAFTFQPIDRIFSEALYVFPLPSYAAFAILQSRVHEPWARLLSSSMKTDLRYAASDCFETFPFPKPDPRTVIPELESMGQRLYEARASYMLDTQQGLTKTYNALKDIECLEPRIVELRELHRELDQAVLAAYGWADVEVPMSPGVRKRV